MLLLEFEQHDAAVRLLVRQDAVDLDPVRVLHDHAGVAVPDEDAAAHDVAVRALVDDDAGVAGVADVVVLEDVQPRAVLDHDAGVRVERRVEDDAADRVVADDVPMAVEEVDRHAVGDEVVVLDEGCPRSRS